LENEFSEIIKSIMALVPVIGGAIIGVAGGLVGTTYAHRLSSGQAKTTEKKEKLESLVTEAYEIEIWLKKQESYFFWDGSEILEQSPISKIEAIVALYFPELNIHVKELSAKTLAYRAWLNEGAQLRLAARTPAPLEEHIAKLSDYYTPLMQSRDEVVNKAKEISDSLHRP
jgi:hypothetical protein